MKLTVVQPTSTTLMPSAGGTFGTQGGCRTHSQAFWAASLCISTVSGSLDERAAGEAKPATDFTQHQHPANFF